MTCIQYTKLADEPTLANGTHPPGTRAEMTCIPLHKTWQMTLLLWPMPPSLVPEQRMPLNTSTPNVADKPTLADGPPCSTRAEMTCIPLHKTWQMNLLWLMDLLQYQSSDDLHTTTQNLADEPTLANGPPYPWVPEKRCLEYHYTKLGRQTYFG